VYKHSYSEESNLFYTSASRKERTLKITLITNPSHQEKNVITDGLWSHNATFHPVEIEPFLLYCTDDDGNVAGGLIAQTWWGTLEIQYLWIAERIRGKGYGKELMSAAEAEAKNRNCHMATVDTFDFQAKSFYEKLGYKEYGSLPGYAHKFRRHYLAKEFT